MFSILIALKVWTHNGYDLCPFYMNNMDWGDWWSDKQLSRKYVFILIPKHIATSYGSSFCLCRNQICFSMH